MSLDFNMAKIAQYEYEIRVQEHRTLQAITRIRREKQGSHPLTLAYRRAVNWLQGSLSLANVQRPATPATKPQIPCLDC